MERGTRGSDGAGGRPAKRRVAVYCRVSTLAEEQDSSYALQQSYYQRRILDDPEMELAGVYGDRGASGRSLKKRQGLQRLLEDCEAGKIDLILVKSISRFARNIKECIETIRRLRQLGISVCFEKEGLNTLDERADLLLNILATIAEEESNSLSRNLLWAHQRRNEAGRPFGKLPYGYAVDKESSAWKIDESKAQRIRYLFEQAEMGRAIGRIREELNAMEARDGTGLRWTAARVSVALGNIAYKGDYLTNRTVALDCSGRRGRNRGQRDQYYIEGHHVPIVPPDVFERVQRLRANRLLSAARVRFTQAERAILEQTRGEALRARAARDQQERDE